MVSDRISLDHGEGMVLCGETNFRLSSSSRSAIMQSARSRTRTRTRTPSVAQASAFRLTPRGCQCVPLASEMNLAFGFAFSRVLSQPPTSSSLLACKRHFCTYGLALSYVRCRIYVLYRPRCTLLYAA